MKPVARLLLAGLCGSAAVQAYVPGPVGLGLRTTVTFFEAEKFTDLTETSSRSRRDQETTLAALNEYFVQQASRVIPANFRLLITVTDVDRAGDFEPWRGPAFDDIRIVRDLYPPRIVLVFRVTDPEGNIVREGRRELRDLTFMSKIPRDQNDSLRFEKELIDAWLREEFGR